jgi:hypothetical protein
MLLSKLSMCIGHEFAHAFSLFMDCSSKCLDVLFPLLECVNQRNQWIFFNPIGIILELGNSLGLKFLRNWSNFKHIIQKQIKY